MPCMEPKPNSTLAGPTREKGADRQRLKANDSAFVSKQWRPSIQVGSWDLLIFRLAQWGVEKNPSTWRHGYIIVSVIT